MKMYITLAFICISLICLAQKPNVIIILTDDQGWGDLSINGNTNLQTPNIDQLAKEGIRFSNFFVQPVCSPTRAEILTGKYHYRSGVISTSAGGERMNSDEKTIAQIFKEAGYRTGIFGKWHNGTQAPYHPNSRGFEEFYGFASGHWGNYFDATLEHNGEIVQGKGYLPDDLTSHAMDFIKSEQNNPFFVMLSLNTPHSPMQVPKDKWDAFKGSFLEMFYKDQNKEDTLFTKAALAMVENIDENVGRVTELIKDLEKEEETIFIFLSDNGPNSYRWNNGMKGRKGSTDEGGVKSPFIIKWLEHLPANEIKNQISSGIDILPTLINLASLNQDHVKRIDGKDLFTEDDDRIIYNYWQKRLSIRTQDFRLDHEDKLYHMLSDPGQERDVSHKYPEIHHKLLVERKNWEEQFKDQINEVDSRPFTIGHPSMDQYHLPARDANFSGEIQRSNKYPNCSFLQHWHQTKDSIYWDVDVLRTGWYEVELYYTCDENDVGSKLKLTYKSESVTSEVERCSDPPLKGMENDVFPRMESYVKDFISMPIGRIKLEKSKDRLVLGAEEIGGKGIIDFRLLHLQFIE